MKNFLYLPAFIAVTLFCSCQKQQTDAERQAEVERQVQERLAAERQTQEQQRLTQGQVDLDQRLKDVENRNAAAAATAAPVQRTQSQAEPQRDRAARPSVTHRTREDSGEEAPANYSTFYTRLEPHGEWRETSNYGYVWQPRVSQQSQNWRPYTNGRWVYTDAGCTWVSDEPFGWATYHYGRWTRLHNVGWVWVPGDEWAPAWVSRRKSNDYVGWAPLPPEARFERGSGIHNWADNYYDIGPDQYAFVPTNQFGDQRVDRAVVSMDRNVAIINQTTNITNITYSNTTVVNQGPNYDEMRSRSQQPMERLRLERQLTVNFDAGDPRSVVRGQVVEIQAPVIERAQRVERPRNVRETIAQVVVDHGWERMGDRQAAEKVRIKMKGEATPPPNAPSRVFVKPAEAVPAAATAATATATVPATTPIATVAATATVAPTVSQAPSASPRREMPPRVRPEASPAASATISPEPSATARAVSTPAVRPSATVSSTPEATASVVSSPTPRINHPVPPPASSPRSFASPSASVATEASSVPPSTRSGRSGEAKEQRKAERQMRRQEGSTAQPGETSPPSSVSSPAGTATPAGTASDSPSLSRRELRKQERTTSRPTQGAGAAVSMTPTDGTSAATATPVGTATSASSATPETPGPASASRRELRKEERKAKRAGEREGAAQSDESPSPSPQ